MKNGSTPKMIWGAKDIGRHINRGPDYVRTSLAKMPNSPVHRAGRRYWAYEDELQGFYKQLAGKPYTNPL